MHCLSVVHGGGAPQNSDKNLWLSLWPALRYGTGYQTVSERSGHQQKLIQAFTEDVFIFSLLVYIAHWSFLDDALKFAYLLTYLLTYKIKYHTHSVSGKCDDCCLVRAVGGCMNVAVCGVS